MRTLSKINLKIRAYNVKCHSITVTQASGTTDKQCDFEGNIPRFKSVWQSKFINSIHSQESKQASKQASYKTTQVTHT